MTHRTLRRTGRLSALPPTGDGLDSLTRREREVLALIAAGWSNEGIREALFLSPKTVESHVHSIFAKLGLRRGSQTHARVLAARAWLDAQSSPIGTEAIRRAA
ncbi:MAG TPA: helix-turn-helix transcriptional regulator [Solirubrobacteraceae bacterium]|nr:helix-turn-helix transcriptional regulator [Solirubrobacteraceae bacterium]